MDVLGFAPRKWYAVGFCLGTIAGLVTIWLGSGFVGSPAVGVYGFVAGTIYNFATQLNFIFGYGDCLDVVASRAIGGIVGNVRRHSHSSFSCIKLMRIFAADMHGALHTILIAGLSSTTAIHCGWFDHQWIL